MGFSLPTPLLLFSIFLLFHSLFSRPLLSNPFPPVNLASGSETAMVPDAKHILAHFEVKKEHNSLYKTQTFISRKKRTTDNFTRRCATFFVLKKFLRSAGFNPLNCKPQTSPLRTPLTMNGCNKQIYDDMLSTLWDIHFSSSLSKLAEFKRY